MRAKKIKEENMNKKKLGEAIVVIDLYLRTQGVSKELMAEWKIIKGALDKNFVAASSSTNK
jgi:hypothetical protein